jgi:hypothetical protein
MDPKDFIHLLAEIRDIQQEHLEEYRRVTSESLQLQRSAVKRQEQIGRLYQRVILVGAILIAAGIGLILYSLGIFRR